MAYIVTGQLGKRNMLIPCAANEMGIECRNAMRCVKRSDILRWWCASHGKMSAQAA